MRLNAGTHAIKVAARALPCRDLNRLMSVMTGDVKDGPAATATLDALRVPYHRVLRVTPATVGNPERHRFPLPKGHGPMAHCTALVADGFFEGALPSGFGGYDSPL